MKRRGTRKTNKARFSYVAVPKSTLKLLEGIFKDISLAAKKIPNAQKEFNRTSYII